MKNIVIIIVLLLFVSGISIAQTGVGTTNPDATLHVKSIDASYPEIKLESEVSLPSSTLLFHTNDDNTGTTLFDTMRIRGGWQDAISTAWGYNRISIEGNNSGTWNTIATITEDIEVGIGTTAPEASLHIFNTGDIEPAALIESDDNVSLRIESNYVDVLDPTVHGEVYVEFINESSSTDAWMLGLNDTEILRLGYRAVGSIGAGTIDNDSHEIEFTPSASTTNWLVIEDYNRSAIAGPPVALPALTNHGLVIRPQITNNGAIGTPTHIFDYGYFNNLHRVNEYTISDRSVKNNITQISNVLDVINKLQGVSYYIDTQKHPFYKGKDVSDEEKHLKHYGFIAQDVKKIIPEMATYDEGLDLNVIKNYNQLLPYLVEAVKEVNTKLDKLSKTQEAFTASKAE